MIIYTETKILIFRVGEDGEWNAVEAILTPTNKTTFQIVDLYPYTVYSFRVVAVNAMGSSLPSRESYYMVTLREGKLYNTRCLTSFSEKFQTALLSRLLDFLALSRPIHFPILPVGH